MLIDVAIPGDRNVINREAAMTVEYKARVEYKKKCGRAETERDGTRAETRFGFPAKRTSPFISAGVSVQSAACSRGVRISGSNAG